MGMDNNDDNCQTKFDWLKNIKLPVSRPREIYGTEQKLNMMKPLIDVVSRLECHGQVKHSGLGCGSSNWKSGHLIIYCHEGAWKIDLFCSTSTVAVLSLKLDPSSIERVICKQTMVISLRHGGDASSLFFKPAPDNRDLKIRDKMQKFADLLMDLKENYCAYEENLTKAGMNLKSTTFQSPSVSRFGSVINSNNTSPSPQKFTSVKEPRKRERYLLGDFSDDECKENEKRGPYQSGKSDVFLQRGTEKAREHLEAREASSFYKTSTPSYAARNYGGFSTYSSTRRTISLPGLMPDPTLKKSRLSDDVPYSWSKTRQSPQTKQTQQHFQGFSNLGNTCYMNAILQSLFGLDTFSTDLLVNQRVLKAVPRDSLYFSLARLLALRKRFVPDQTKRDLLKNVKAAISSSAKRFSGYQQHDAHEFLGQVLDQLKEEVNKVLKSTPSPHRDSSDRESSTSQEYINPTFQNFEFEVQHTITCTQCRENVSKAEQFNDLSMEMPRSRNVLNTRSIQEALDLFFRKETLEYTCEKCGCNKAEVSHKFTRLPRVLVLHLKRYRYDMSASRHAKVGHNIHIPRFLTLQSHCVEETTPAFPAALPPDHKSYRFKKSFNLDSSEDSKSTDQNAKTPCKKLKYGDTNKEDDVEMISMNNEDDPELAKVLELSLKEANDKTNKYTEDNLIDSGDTELEKVLEISRLENEKSVNLDHEYGKELQGMSEEEQLRLAIEQSLRETEFNFSSMEDEENTDLVHSSRSTTISSLTDLSYNSAPSGNQSLNHSAIKSHSTECFVSSNLETESEYKSKSELENFLFGSDDEKKQDVTSNLSGTNDNLEFSNDNDCDKVNTHSNVLNDKTILTSVDSIQNKLEIEGRNVKSEISRGLNTESEKKNENISHRTDQKNLKTNTETDLTDDDIVLLCTEDTDMDSDWLSLENKENKKPHGHTTNIIKHDAEEEIDDPPLPQVDNEKGDLPYSYRLISVVNHIGNSSVVGHYVSDVYDIQKGSWFSCDDSHVVKASESEVRTKRERSGYIFFYLSKEIFEDLQTHFSLQNGKRKSSDY